LHPGFRLAASLILVVAGIAAPLQAWIGWMRSERALRLNSPLPSAALSLPIGIAVVAAGGLVLLAMIFA
jgi:putative membrane protein